LVFWIRRIIKFHRNIRLRIRDVFEITEIFIKDKYLAGSQKSEVFKKYIVLLHYQKFLNFHFSLKITIFALQNLEMSLLQEISKRKTFGIISHPDAGKTTLTEKLLLLEVQFRKRVL
jgi:ABC-type polysaccharide/polyol phosphate transport system ATPase subunit